MIITNNPFLTTEYGPGSKERCQELMAFGREGAASHITIKKVPQDPATPSPPTDRFSECKLQGVSTQIWLGTLAAQIVNQPGWIEYQGLISKLVLDIMLLKFTCWLIYFILHPIIS